MIAKKGQAVIIGSIFLVLSLAILFISMPILGVFIAQGMQSLTDEPFTQLLVQMFPFMLFVVIVIAFFIIVRSE